MSNTKQRTIRPGNKMDQQVADLMIWHGISSYSEVVRQAVYALWKAGQPAPTTLPREKTTLSIDVGGLIGWHDKGIAVYWKPTERMPHYATQPQSPDDILVATVQDFLMTTGASDLNDLPARQMVHLTIEKPLPK